MVQDKPAVVENEDVVDAISNCLDSMQDSLDGAKDNAGSKYKGNKILPVQRMAEHQGHYFRAQIVILGKANKYWVNLNGFRDWIRFRIVSTEQVLDLVVAGHLVRDPNKGVIVAYVEKYPVDEKPSKLKPFQVVEPFWISAEEDPKSEEDRFRIWKKRAAKEAISYWEKDIPEPQDDLFALEDEGVDDFTDSGSDRISDGELDEYLVTAS